MSEQTIEMTVEAVAATLRKLTDATDGIRKYVAMSPTGGPQGGVSQAFDAKLHDAVIDFNQRTAAMTAQLQRLREAIQSTAEDFVAHDAEAGQVQTQLNSQLAAANTSLPPTPIRPLNAGMK